MASPAHRDAMLGADFTHVGIGAVVSAQGALPQVDVTLVFARETGAVAEDVPQRVLEATDMARLPHALPRLALDASLSRAAEQGMAVLASDPTATTRALDAARTAAVRVRAPSSTTCVVLFASADATRLEPPAATKDARAARLGVAALPDPNGPDTFFVLFVVQSAPGKGLTCH